KEIPSETVPTRISEVARSTFRPRRCHVAAERGTALLRIARLDGMMISARFEVQPFRERTAEPREDHLLERRDGGRGTPPQERCESSDPLETRVDVGRDLVDESDALRLRGVEPFPRTAEAQGLCQPDSLGEQRSSAGAGDDAEARLRQREEGFRSGEHVIAGEAVLEPPPERCAGTQHHGEHGERTNPGHQRTLPFDVRTY